MNFVGFLLSFLLLWEESQSQFLMNSISPVVDGKWEAFTSTVAGQLEEIGNRFDTRALLHNVLVALKSSQFPTAVASNISQQCIEDSQSYVHSLYLNRSLWALQMQESSGQLPPGLFGALNFQADGLFDECKAVRAPTFKGQYCKVFFKNAPVDQTEIITQVSPDEEHNERSNFITIFQLFGQLLGSDRIEPKMSGAGPYTFVLPSISFCLPSSCSAADLGQAVAELVGSYVIANNSIVTVTDEQYCFKDADDKPVFDGPDITVIVVLSLLGVLIVSATIHEAYRMYCGIGFDSNADGKLLSALHCFSVLSNGRKILSMKVTASSANDNFGCIHGIRFFSTCWVVLGHSWSLMPYKTMNPKAVLADAYSFGMQTIVNGSVSVDTFFLMSGLLVSFLLLRELDRNKGKFNVGFFYLHRYLRLTPVYAVIIGFVATLMVYLGTGPNWYNVNLLSNACRISWWRQFLYINNLFPVDPYHQCIGQAWYLAVDMQLFILSPLFIYPLWRWRKAGLACLAFVALISYATIFAAYAIYDLPPAYIPTRLDNLGTASDFYDHYYLKPWTRAPLYLLGIWTGWYLHITKESPCRMSKTLTAIGWTASAAVGIAVVYGLTPYVDQSEVPDISSTVSMIYGPSHRTTWACVIAWIIFACSRGYGGTIWFHQSDSIVERLLTVLSTHYPDSIPLIGKDRLVKDYFATKPSGLISVKCYPHQTGKALLMGDAAHAMVPFYGQGMNAGFEDCLVFNEFLNQYGDHNLEKVLPAYTEYRHVDAHAICDLAVYNFVEMRDLVNRFSFLVRKRFDTTIHWLFPNWWVPLYTSVTFSRMRYHLCIENKKWQDRVVRKLVWSTGTAVIATAVVALYNFRSYLQKLF